MPPGRRALDATDYQPTPMEPAHRFTEEEQNLTVQVRDETAWLEEGLDAYQEVARACGTLHGEGGLELRLTAVGDEDVPGVTTDYGGGAMSTHTVLDTTVGENAVFVAGTGMPEDQVRRVLDAQVEAVRQR